MYNANQPMPVIRDNPKPKRKGKGSRKLLVFLFLFFITLLVILFFRSPISRITSIEISGNRYLSATTIRQTANVHKGQYYFFTSASSMQDKLAKLPIAASIKVTKHFPGKVEITVKEHPEVALQLTAAGQKTVLLANGSSVPYSSDSGFMNLPILTGWKPNDPVVATLCKSLSVVPGKLLSDISEIKPIPTSLYPDKILIYTRSRFEWITTARLLPRKIEYVSSITENNEPGILEMLEANVYTPYGKTAEEATDSPEKGTSSTESQDND